MTDGQTERQASRQTGRQTDRQAGRQTGRQTGRQAGRQAGRPTDRPTDRHADRHADRQADRQDILFTGYAYREPLQAVLITQTHSTTRHEVWQWKRYKLFSFHPTEVILNGFRALAAIRL